MKSHYEAFESTRGGYGYVDIREDDGGSTVLGADGSYTYAQCEEIADLLNDVVPAPGSVVLNAEQAGYLRSLLHAARSTGTLEYEGGDLSEKDFEDLCTCVDIARDEVEAAPSDGMAP